MSLNSITSRIVEQVNQELLDDDGFSTVELWDYQKSDNPFETATRIKSPFNFDSRKFLANCGLMDLDRYIEVAKELIQDAEVREGKVENERVDLVEDYPAEDFSRFGDEVIAWKLMERVPARMSADGNSRPQRSFTHYYKIRSPKYPNKWLAVEARPLDHTVEFQCWSKSARLANRRALWLERLFVNHAWAFIVQGADRMFFKRRGSDWYTTTGGQHLYVRPVQFTVRAWEFKVKAESVIKHITFEIGSMTSDQLDSKGF